MGLIGYKGDFSLICNGLFHLKCKWKHLWPKKKVRSCLLREVEYKGSWDISMSLIYYLVIQRRKIDITLNYQAGFLKKDPQICLGVPHMKSLGWVGKGHGRRKSLWGESVRVSRIVGRLYCGLSCNNNHLRINFSSFEGLWYLAL